MKVVIYHYAREYLNNYILPYDKIDLLLNITNHKYILSYFNIFLKLSKKFSYYFNQNYKCLYPIIGKLSYEENKKRIIKILKKYNGNVLVKCHADDTRDFSKIKTLFCSYLISLIFCTEKNDVRFLIPQNREYIYCSEKIFRNIDDIISPKIKFL